MSAAAECTADFTNWPCTFRFGLQEKLMLVIVLHCRALPGIKTWKQFSARGWKRWSFRITVLQCSECIYICLGQQSRRWRIYISVFFFGGRLRALPKRVVVLIKDVSDKKLQYGATIGRYIYTHKQIWSYIYMFIRYIYIYMFIIYIYISISI